MNRRSFLKAATALAVMTGTGRVARAAPRLAPEDAVLRTEAAHDAQAWRAARRFVATSVGRVAVVERGGGPQAALFLHGLPLNSFQWRGASSRPASGAWRWWSAAAVRRPRCSCMACR